MGAGRAVTGPPDDHDLGGPPGDGPTGDGPTADGHGRAQTSDRPPGDAQATGDRRRPVGRQPVGRRPVGRRAQRRAAVDVLVAELSLQLVPAPRRILAVGQGSVDLLRRLASASPTAIALVGVEALAKRPRRAHPPGRRPDDDDRLRVDVGTADSLRYADGVFDLVCTTAFERWSDQPAGLAQCARVLAPGGQLVLTGHFARRRNLMPPVRRARSRRRAEDLLAGEGFGSVQWHDVHGRSVRAVTATASRDSRPAATRAS